MYVQTSLNGNKLLFSLPASVRKHKHNCEKKKIN